MAQLWTELSKSSHFRRTAVTMLARIAVAMVAVSVEDERVFSAMNFVCSPRCSSLTTHLEECVRMMVQEVFNLGSFPYRKALDVYDRIVKSTHDRESTKEGSTVVE